MNAVILATTDRNSKQISEIKVKKEKETKDREPIQILVKIPIDSKMAARLQKNNSIRTKAEIMPGIPNALSKQERKDNQKNKTQSNKHSPGILTCGQCPKSFRTIVGMTNHLQNHFKPTYQCSQCPNTFPTLQKLNNHVSRSHKFKRVSCNVCKKSFKAMQIWKFISGRIPVKDHFLASNAVRDSRKMLHSTYIIKYIRESRIIFAHIATKLSRTIIIWRNMS